ncbi:M16 family metallopeptidase [Saccharothrix variisporea]|uniref:Putative Zn-dependent peptidase n=1 Tax=Saccharothrix variisporea TaxID=543527 RepID=A0A495X8W1_9PSEU|nr:pitrilysin family protein [Saccharothrix variisporea]RKT69304.1 putative Zn-dependent peptidase [Saccharothrix variisporea]
MTRLSYHPVTDARLRTSAICLTVDCGSRDDPEERGGLAHLLEHLLMTTPTVNGTPFLDHVEHDGGKVTAETGLDRLRFTAQVAAEDTADTVERLVDAVLRPRFDADTLRTERAVVVNELAGGDADPVEAAQHAVLDALFPDHPLGRPVGGTPAGITGTDLADLRAHHAEVFARRRAALVVVGPETPDAPGHGAEPALVRPPTPLGPPRHAEPIWPDTFGWLCLGARSPAAGDRRRPAFDLLTHLLGTSSASLLFRELRGVLGLGHSFETWDRGYGEAGAWRVLVGVEPGTAPRVVQAVTDVLDRVARGAVAPAALAATVRRVGTGLLLDAEDPARLARTTADRVLDGAADWSVDDELDRLRAVTADEVADAAAHVREELLAVVRPEGSR